jgi:hypothetical protein
VSGKYIDMDLKIQGGSFMLDNVFWTVFEKTGSIDAYLLYIDLKDLNNIKDVGAKLKAEIKGLDIR